MLNRVLIAVTLGCAALGVQAQGSINKQCAWGVLSKVDKATAAQAQCNAYSGLNGFRENNPRRNEWISACMGIVTNAVAGCADTDVACVKNQINPLMNQVCALNGQFK